MSEKSSFRKRKVAIVGAGAVGSTFAYALAQDGVADEIVLIDVDRELAEGEVLDLGHGLPYLPPVRFRAGDAADYADAQVIVITAGSAQNKGESRLDLLRRNAQIVEGIVDDISQADSEAVLLVVTNPVDVLTQVALDRSKFPKHRVMGSGTVLDSARFRYFLSRHCGVDSRNVHGYILGEHGDSEIAAWSLTHIAGAQMDAYCAVCGRCENWRDTQRDIAEQVRNSAYHIIDYKGATNFAIGLSLVRIVGAILRNERSVLTVSSQLDGEYGIHGICLSVPCLVSERGVEQVIAADLTDRESAALRHSADVLKKAHRSLREGGQT